MQEEINGLRLLLRDANETIALQKENLEDAINRINACKAYLELQAENAETPPKQKITLRTALMYFAD